MLRFFIAVLLIASSSLLMGCGVTFGGAPEGNDFFTSLDVTGEKVVGAPLTASLAWETLYTVPVDIICELRHKKELVREIGRTQAPALPRPLDPDDEDRRVPGNISFDFVAEQPGELHVECYTPLDKANFIIESFDIPPAQ